MHPDALGPTAPQAAPPPGAFYRPPPQHRPPPYSTKLAIFVVVALVVALVLGVVIGRASSTATLAAVTTPAPSTIGRLHVQSSPVDGNVVVDGRFAGVAPIERLDLDPGKHSVVIDAFGYQPYSGTLQIEPRGTLNLSITLAALNSDAATSGSFSGAGTAKYIVVPASALLPARAPTTAAEPARKPRPTTSTYTPPPPPPRRDCGGEKSRCRDGCSRAETDCRFSCPTCSSCLTSMGQEECTRQCNTCRSGCEQNTKFCESSCDSQYGSCEASQP